MNIRALMKKQVLSLKRLMFKVLRFLEKLVCDASYRRGLKMVVKPYDCVFYCTMPLHYAWVEPTFRQLLEDGLRAAVFFDSNNIMQEATTLNKDHYIIDPFFLRFLKCKIVVSASTNLDRWFMPINAESVHMPHSLVSLHAVYTENAFDGFDWIFACGKHHLIELQELRAMREELTAGVKLVGYGKTESIIRSGCGHKKAGDSLVVIAPSWGDKNILESIGVELVGRLLSKGYYVTVRPHPSFFSKRRFGKEGSHEYPILEDLKKQFEGDPGFSLENSTGAINTLLSADVLVSDYSGAAYEYMFYREKPVVFVDVPLKIANNNWKTIATEPMEIKLRDQLGILVSNNIDDAVKSVDYIINGDITHFAELIRREREYYEVNHGSCSIHAAKTLKEMLSHDG